MRAYNGGNVFTVQEASVLAFTAGNAGGEGVYHNCYCDVCRSFVFQMERSLILITFIYVTEARKWKGRSFNPLR